MSTRFTCDDTERLVAYIYEELDPAERGAIARHLEECAQCHADVTALGGVRHALSQWTPPAPPLRFSVVQEPVPATVIRPTVASWQAVPRWAQVAAATLAVGVGAAIANVQVRHDAAGWTVSTGWTTPAAPTAAPPADEKWRAEMAALEQSLRSEIDGLAPAARTAAVERPSTGGPDAATVSRVQGLIDASERRQQQELALRLTQLGRDLDIQRRADLVRIDQGIGQLEGRTSAEVARQRQMLDLIVRAGFKPPQ